MNYPHWKRPDLDITPRKTFLHAAVWLSAGLVGVLAVLYARLISALQGHFFSLFHSSKQNMLIVSASGPFLFVAATWLVKKFAPNAKGSGIPQVLAAIDQAKEANLHPKVEGREVAWQSSLISIRTAVVKVLSSSVGILAGASIGREGPTVQIAASGFAWIGHRIRKYAPEIDFQSFLVAGGAAGVAAAFNTPIAGITFALEEIADGIFGPFRQLVMLAVIIAGVIAQGLSGNYLYFGAPVLAKTSIMLLLSEAVLIGLISGFFGGLFARCLAYPDFFRLPKSWVARAFLVGLICSAIGYFTDGDTSGSGYEVTRHALESSSVDTVSLSFPILKFATSVLSYLSGMAGGIFSPSLSIGAGIGMGIAKLAHFVNFKACALLGMVAFFSGAIRAPLTGVIIVMEMTNEHELILPFLIAAYIAQSVGRRVMPIPLYHFLAKKQS